MQRLWWIASFGIAAPFALAASFLLLLSYWSPSPNLPRALPQVLSYSNVYEPQTFQENSINSEIVSSDARPLLVKNYLARYQSELEPYAEEIVQVSDKYGLDFRLLVAIAQQESNLCKRIPENSYNCWGFGIYGDKVTRFESYSQAFEAVAKTLKRDYIDRGLDTPEKIMVKYTPPSVALGGPWARGVSQFMSEME